jgi:hypothetical protein
VPGKSFPGKYHFIPLPVRKVKKKIAPSNEGIGGRGTISSWRVVPLRGASVTPPQPFFQTFPECPDEEEREELEYRGALEVRPEERAERYGAE